MKRLILAFSALALAAGVGGAETPDRLVFVEGGTFQMGSTSGESSE